MRQGGCYAGVIEDASLVEDYGSIGSTYCSFLITIANFSENCCMRFRVSEQTMSRRSHAAASL
jgi:hypothetical protein